MGKEQVTRANPCCICGKGDWCFRTSDNNGFISHWCMREELAPAGYIHKNDHQSTNGVCHIFVDEATNQQQKNLWVEEQKRLNPNFGKSNSDYSGRFDALVGGKTYKTKEEAMAAAKRASERPSIVVPNPQIRKAIEQEELKIAELKKINAVNRALVKACVLEQHDFKKLDKEWGLIGKTNEFATQWQIKTLPPIDPYRYRNPVEKATLKNLFRTQIVEKVLKEAGNPDYVPGWYLGAKNYTFSSINGIIFPEYDPWGNMYRLRIQVQSPDKKGEYKGIQGVYHHKRDNGYHVWEFTPDDNPNNIQTVYRDYYYWEPEGKASNKYLNFSSYKAEVVDGVEKNKYLNGAQSGSQPSIYTMPGDSYDIIDVTEGEKKAIVNNAITHRPTIALPGVSTYSVLFKNGWFDELVSRGMCQMNVIFDCDKNDNKNVMNAQNGFLQMIHDKGVVAMEANWSKMWASKGLDDCLLNGVMPRFKEPEWLKNA